MGYRRGDQPSGVARSRALLLMLLSIACGSRQETPTTLASEDEGERIVLEPGTPEYDAFFESIRQNIVASREQLVPIFVSGDVAQMTVEGKKVTVERLSEEHTERIATILERDFPADTVSPRWLRRRSGIGRIFLIMGTGTLLINADPDSGLSLEPGSLDAAWQTTE